MTHELDGLKVAILAEQGFEQQELEEPREALEKAGATITIVSPHTGKIRGWKHKDWGSEVKVDLLLERAHAADFDALMLPGGVMNPDRLRMNPAAVALVREFADLGKPIAAICHAPWMLVEAGLVKGKRVTSWPSLMTDVNNAGGSWVDEPMVRDGWIVTSRKPDDIPLFNRGMIEMFREARGHAHAA